MFPQVKGTQKFKGPKEEQFRYAFKFRRKISVQNKQTKPKTYWEKGERQH